MSTLKHPSEAKTPIPSCVNCDKLSESQCGRCGTRYCGRACQKMHWPAHKAACRLLTTAKTLRGKGVPERAIAELVSLMANPPAEPYTGPKGRGLRTLHGLPAGACVGYIVGPDVGGDRGIESFRDYTYLWESVVGDVARERILPESVNASLINDAMPAEAYTALLEEGPLAFIKTYPIRLPGHGVFLERVPGNGAWGAYRAVTLSPVGAGAALETFYGPHYWLNHLANASLPGTRFAAAWEANRIISRGGREFQDAMVRSSLGGREATPESRDFIVQSSQIEGVPVWLRDQGVVMVYCGIGGVDYFPIDPEHKAILVAGDPGYVVAPWAVADLARIREADAKVRAIYSLYEGVVSVMLTARGLSRQLNLANMPLPVSIAAQKLITHGLTDALRGVTLGVPANVIARIIVYAPDDVDALVETVRARGDNPKA